MNLDVRTVEQVRDTLRSASHAYGARSARILASAAKWLDAEIAERAAQGADAWLRLPNGAPIILPNAADGLPSVLRRAAATYRESAECSHLVAMRTAWHGAANILFDTADELEQTQFAAFGR